MRLNLSETKVGVLQPPKEWNNSEQKMVPLNARQVFLKRFDDSKSKYKKRNNGKTFDFGNQEIETTHQLEFRQDSIEAGQAFHKNYMEYLQKAWGDHLSIVISPDIVWYTLLCELAAIVKADPEQYRNLFTDSPEKKTITVITAEMIVMPLNEMVGILRDVVPTDSSKFFPEFSTQTERSVWAYNAAFADMCSPYYNYCMLMCGFPSIDVRGTHDDWNNLYQSWQNLKDIVPGKWHKQVSAILSDIYSNLDSASFWKGMFRLDRCGSGGQVEVSGWWAKLFMTQPDVAYPENYAPHVSIVSYTQLNLKKDYEMRVGLFFSKQEEEFLVPDYGYVVHEKLKEPVVTTGEYEMKIESRTIGKK